MGFWNYRVLVGDGYAEIIECHYDSAGDMWGYSKAAPVGNDPDDLKGELYQMRSALKRPVVHGKDLPKVITGQAPKRPRLEGFVTAEVWRTKFMDALEAELKDRLVTLSLEEWEWKVLIDALKHAATSTENPDEGQGKL